MSDLTKYAKGKRMVQEDKIKQIENNKADIEALKEQVEEIPVVEANPVLEGTEGDLTSLQVGETKYKVGGGDGFVIHRLEIELYDNDYLSYINATCLVFNTSSTNITTLTDFKNNILNSVLSGVNTFSRDGSNEYPLIQMYVNANNNKLTGIYVTENGPSVTDIETNYPNVTITDTH